MPHEHIRRESAQEDAYIQDYGNDEKEARKLGQHPDRPGQLETEAMRHGRAKASAKSRIPHYREFKSAYDRFLIPAHHSELSLARANDLLRAGAPRTPADIDAKTAAKFHQIDNLSSRSVDIVGGIAANQMIKQNNDLTATHGIQMNNLRALEDAALELSAARDLIAARRLKLKGENVADQIDKINKQVEFLDKFIGVCKDAAKVAAGDEIDVLKSLGKKAIKTVSPNEVLLALTGNTANMQKLQETQAQIIADMDAHVDSFERKHIATAFARMNTVKQQAANSDQTVRDQIKDGRNAAHALGQSRIAGVKGILTTMMAQAYQELALFGDSAKKEATNAENAATARGEKEYETSVVDWLDNHMQSAKADAARGRLTEEVVDYREARANVITVFQGKKFFAEEVPKWIDAANAWRHFLKDITGKEFGEVPEDKT